ncbi:glycoside hydrolase family 3 protein [Carboxylicivirga linearis]|uniref:Glycoside hydrolase family 3 C-terminal domain-containing protein n=1 Tax=Carboxylicivirga linearis TaxID=1628157 RepID=A0ABS5JXR8_9BACT|nr:glycoside hydrolase family 3 protein [Carboxylicivirga linearis]MBS2099715.1 glycoside hydrolase family 3 C-terminal domain-containing protein [Carboxylicivirga linearis]
MRLKIVLFIISLMSLLYWGCNTSKSSENNLLSFEKRVDDLVAKMTLDEKVSQLRYDSPAISHLNIPEYNWWNECLHGVGRSGLATVFPQAIGMAAMWDDQMMFSIADAVSDEARGKYNKFHKEGKRGIYHGLTFWTPNINIFRDPRWGRGMETYGEDPYLSGELGVAYIKGLQGDDSTYFKLVATAKHFAVHSGPESNRHSFNVKPSQYDFLETYSSQFKMAVLEADVYSVMCAYNRLDDLPCCGNSQLSSLLRDDWGFDGYIVSDCWAVRDFYEQNAHEVVNTKAEAAAMSVKAGTDLNCGDSYPALVEAVEKGYVSESEIDVSVKRLLLARMKLGMFDADAKVPYASISSDVIDSEQHRLLALQAARKSMVLLKNDDHLLPFPKSLKKVAVIGPNAKHIEALLGNYNGYPSHPITPLEGIKEKLPNAKITYALGCKHAKELPYLEVIPGEFLYTDETLSKHGLKAEYYRDSTFVGDAVLSRIDEELNFKWWDKGPGEPVNGDDFSAVWTGYLVPDKTGEYTVGGQGFNFFSVQIDDEVVCERGGVHDPIRKYKQVYLEAGKKYKVRCSFKHKNSEYALARLLWEVPNDDLQKDAIDVASNADAIVLCMGLSPLLEGEEMKVEVEGFSGGDRVAIGLPKVQEELIKKIVALNRPTVLVLMNGSALAVNWEDKNISSILEAWYPGQAGGQAIADVLFGDYNPAGRLPLTFYKSLDQLPDFENYNMEGRTYRYFKGEPLYQFGHGLSYTTFEYSDLIVPSEVFAGEALTVSVDVANTGKYDGDEVVQLYVSHPDSDYKVAIRSLKAFKRIHLKAGEHQTVTLTLQPEDMAVLNDDYQYIIDGAPLKVSVGGCQPCEEAIIQQKTIESNVNIQLIDNEVLVLK